MPPNDALRLFYEREHPGRKIDDTLYPYPDYLTALKTAFAGGNEPDTMLLQPGALMSEYQPYLVPLDSYCVKLWGSDYRKPFVPLGIREALNADPAHKALYGLPIAVFAGDALFYNAAIFKQYNLGIPKSYADLKAIADILNGHGIVPIAWGAKDGWPNVDWFLMVVEQTAPGVWDAAQHGKAPFTHPGIVQALELLVKMQKDRIFSRNAWGTTAYPEAITLFESGKAAMYLTGDWDILGFASPGTKVRDNIRLAALPPLAPGLKPGRLFGGINGALCVSKAAKDPQAAFDFIAWQAGPVGSKETWVDRQYYLPARTDVAPAKIAPQWAAMKDYFYRALPTAIDREPLSALVKQALQDAVANTSVMGQDATKAAAAIQAAYNKSKA
jgi:raffinose/stachyose/melibiose transport system substrate-binding protein